MAEVMAHSGPSSKGERKSKSPSVGPFGISGRLNRKVRVIEGNLVREDSSSSPVVPKTSISPRSSSSPPPPVSPSLSSSGSYCPVTIGEHPQPKFVNAPVSHFRRMTSPPEIVSYYSRGHSRDPSDNSLTSASDEATSLPYGYLDKAFVPPKSPSTMSWRSSTSSLADTSLSSLVNQPSSEISILQAVKKQMMQGIQRTKELQQETTQIPKLKKDITELTIERQKLLNELLEQKAVVLQLKQRVSLLHEQNQELAKLAQSDVKEGGSGPILAIRNTLVATLAQLKQMESQVQNIPSLKSQIKELQDENHRLKDQQLALPSADFPEGVSGSQYQALMNENETLRESNEQLTNEMSEINKQLKSLSNNCDGLQKRMELFQSLRKASYPLQERVKHLEAEKDALYQQLVDTKFQGHPTSDLDVLHLRKKVKSLKKINSKLQSKIEEMRVNMKQEKEHLVLKLFEIELLNTKTSKFELDKEVVSLERLHIGQTRSVSVSSSISPSPQPSSCTFFNSDEEHERSLSPDSKLQLLKLRQLEIHSHETQNFLQAMMTERHEMETRIQELQSQLEEFKQSNSQQKLEETESKLMLARDRIKSLERGLKSVREMTPDGMDGFDEKLQGKFEAMQDELKRLSKVERDTVGLEGKLRDLEQSRYTNDKLRHEKHKLEKKSREGRHRLKTLAKELSQSAELVKSFQKQCLDMESQLEKSTEETKKLKEDNATLRAELEVKDLDLQSHTKAGANGAAAATVEASVVSELQGKYSQLLTELSSLNDKHENVTKKLVERESEVETLKCEVDGFAAKEKEMKKSNEQLSEKMKALERDLEVAKMDKVKVEEISDLLSEKTKMLNELEIQMNELKESQQSLLAEAKTLRDSVESLTADLRKTEVERDSLQQKVDILSNETPSLVKQSTELRVAKDEAERRLEAALKEQEEMSTKAVAMEEKLQKSEKMGKEYRSKLRLLQADLDEAESKLDRIVSNNEALTKEIGKVKDDSAGLAKGLKDKEQDLLDAREQLEREKGRLVKIEKQLQEAEECADAEKARTKELQKELEHVREVEVKKLHSELGKTVSEMGQLTTDYSARVSRIRELEDSFQQAEAEKNTLSHRLSTVEKEVGKAKEEVKKKEEELKELRASHSTAAAAQSRSHSEELKKLRDEVTQYQLQKKKSDKEIISLKDESSLLKEQSKINQTRLSDIQKTLQHRDEEVRKAYDSIAVQNKEFESCKKKLQELETQCEMLTATKDNLLRRLDRMEKLEMEHDMLKHKVQEALGQSSQLRNDNKALLQLLEGVETERPTFEKEATRNLQEENIELHQQVSLLSQWNDKHQRTITTLEQHVENMEEEKRQILVELMQMQSHEQENKQLKKELGEVELEVNRLRRQAHSELLQEEMKVKLETQGQLLSVFNEHNKALQCQVNELHARIKELGGQLARDKPVSPPPMPEPSEDLQVPLDGLESIRRCSELELLNANLQQKIAFLEAELLSAQEISPKIRRRSSALLAASSIPSVPANEDAFISVPEEMLLPCSVLADAFTNKMTLPESVTENYLRKIGEGWFGAVAQKSVTVQCLQSYTTTFGHLSERLLKLIVNMKDMRGNTALHHTLANGNFPAVSVLLDLKCCDSNSTNKAGYTPLMLAAAHNVRCGEHKPVMQKLLDKTDLNIKSKVELQTALMLAVSSGSIELVSMFLDTGADVNAQDKDGSTALMFACEKGYEDIVKKLLSNPACSVSLKDNDSQTAYDIALSYSHNEICTLLKKHRKFKKR